MKEFNTTAVCIPSRHYMVDLSERVKEIKKLVDAGKYFVINRARQYGKTTTLNELKKYLRNDYSVLSLDFQGVGQAGFSTEEKFVQEFCRLIWDRRKSVFSIPEDVIERIEKWKDSDTPKVRLGELFDLLTEWCEQSEKNIVLIIDEVDSAANNQVFLDFLAQLRGKYIARDTDDIPTFQSVILAGVNDIRHLKSKIRDDEQHKVNSPWNIAADFNIDMSLSADGIEGMLDEYAADHNIGINTKELAEYIRDYTAGYPFLVSRICQIIDKAVSVEIGQELAWTRRGVDEAVKRILAEDNALFQSITGKLVNYPELKAYLRSVLMEGTRLVWNSDNEGIVQMKTYGFIRNENNSVKIDNRIFETRLYNLFLSEEDMKNNVFSKEGETARNRFVKDDKLDMRLILEQFIKTYIQIFGPLEDRFKEKDGRELFLLYLKPIINGTGNYYIEAQTRNQTRTDVIVDYLGQQYIIELKIWRGDRYNEDGEKQISEYLDYYNLDTGYMLSFNFNKNKKTGVERVNVGDKVLYEGMV